MKKRLWIAIVLLGGVLISGSVTGRKPPSRTDRFPTSASVPLLYTEGIKASLMGADTALREGFFTRALKLDSTHAPSWYELALLHEDRPLEAIPYCRKACELDSTNLWYRTLLGQLMIGAREYDSALVVYESLLKLSPNPEVYYRLAALHDLQGQSFQAINLLDSAENRFGILEQLSDFKRQLLIKVKLYDRALAEADALIASYPYDEANYIAQAELYARMGRDSSALEAYRTARQLNPGSIPALISLNEFYKGTGDIPNFLATARELMAADELPVDAKIHFYEEVAAFPRDFLRRYYPQVGDLISTLVMKYPDNYRITELYAGHLLGGGNLEEALTLYKHHLLSNQGVPNREAFNEVLNIEAYLKRPDSVARYSEMALHYFPSDPDLYIRKGSVLSYFMKDYPAAEAAYLQALKYTKNDSLRSVLYGILGDTRHQMGDWRTCFKYYEKAIRADTTNSMACNNYSYFLSERNEKLELAEKLAIRANRLSPSNPTYLDTQAWVYYKQGRYEEAKALMQQAIALDANPSEELLIHYGDILYALKENFMAAFYWKKARDKGYDAAEVEKRLQNVGEK